MSYLFHERRRAQPYYETMQVCLNGHQITDRYNSSPELRRKYCNEYGAETIHQCPNCGTPVRGDYIVPGVLAFSRTPVPKRCHECGQPYPWTERLEQEDRERQQAARAENAFETLENILYRFHRVARQVRHRHDNRPTLNVEDEYDVQDLLHALLLLHFDDVRTEEWTPSYAGGASRMDFLLKNEQIVVEVKRSRPTLKAKEVGEQLIVDIERYHTHPDCKTLYCFVCDPEERIINPHGLEQDLSREPKGDEDLTIRVIIVPRR